MSTYEWAEPNAPKPQATRSGCKVRWKYYDNSYDAEAASKAAEHDAEIQLRRGYDFGYCCPGSIRWCEPNSSTEAGESGRWEVCFP
jgi:hypothetical protein